MFRPRFARTPNNDIYIADFVEVDSFAEVRSRRLRSLVDTNVAANLQPDDLIFGVPLVFGARKRLPNFNEFAMQAIFQATRKLEIRRPSETAPRSTWRTNMMFVIGLSNIIGAEAWNSYRANYRRPVDIYVTNYLTMTLTNDASTTINVNPVIGRQHSIPNPTNSAWFGYNNDYPPPSFAVPLRTNVVFLPDAAFVPGIGFTTNWAIAWDRSQNFRTPRWGLAVTNRLQFIIVDRNSGRLIDYVLLEGLNNQRDLSEEIRDADDAIGFDGMWSTNLLAGNLPQGIMNQIDVSLGNQGSGGADWNEFGLGQPTGTTKDYAIDYFRVLYGLSPLKYPGLINTSLVQQVPFTPSKRVSQYLTWQANDPLVHYTAGDLAYLATAGSIVKHSLKGPVQAIKNIGQVNDRYAPWGGNPNLTSDAGTDPGRFNLAIKDPGVGQSDDWQFPTNKFPNIGWLGRVHRGTPWQTIYMKSPEVLADRANGLAVWTNWTGNNLGFVSGNNLVFDAERSAPESDRLLFDVFTTALNENATRGQLSINQTNLAAWSALFTGVAVLSNSPANQFPTNLTHDVIKPAGIYHPADPNRPAMVRLVEGINRERHRLHPNSTNYVYPGQTFRHVGDILAVPELSTNSPFLNLTNDTQLQKGINDAVYEWLPQQVMGLLRVGEPRFVVYSYGQTLRPARNSLFINGNPINGLQAFNGMCTNYQITAEVATRTVLRVVGSPDPAQANHPDPDRRYPPRIVAETFNLLPPD